MCFFLKIRWHETRDTILVEGLTLRQKKLTLIRSPQNVNWEGQENVIT